METNRFIEMVVKQSIDRASQVLSKTLRAGSRIELESISAVDISQATEKMMLEGDKEVMGCMIDLGGDIRCKFLFVVSAKDALILTDLMLRNELGTTNKLNAVAESAIQEVGNILSGCISNSFSKDFNISVMPSVPIIFHDFLGGIFSNFIFESSGQEDSVWLVQTKFLVIKVQIECEMFLIPHTQSFFQLYNPI
ncbi:MAG: chemotaxis protein CheC [Candidatus Aminicenantes bacterium]|nr:chemotaxis protein CheC [Candidatus Aminicenantes bacterium]